MQWGAKGLATRTWSGRVCRKAQRAKGQDACPGAARGRRRRGRTPRSARRTAPAGRRRARARGPRWTSTIRPSAPTAAAARESGSTRRRSPAAWRRVDDHRQVRVQLEPRDRAEVEREARRGLEGADPALAEDHVLVALLEDVVGGLQQLVERRRQPALEQHRLAELARDLEQRVVLHVARADLHDVGVLGDRVGVLGVEQLGDDRQPGLVARLGEDLERRDARGPGTRTARCAA